jgi:hypothetical protein
MEKGDGVQTMGLRLRYPDLIVATCNECGAELLVPNEGSIIEALKSEGWGFARGTLGEPVCWCPACDAEYVPVEGP